MINTFNIIILFLSINILWTFYKIIKIYFYIWHNNKNLKNKIKNKYIFLIPWYKEQSIVNETLSYYKTILDLSDNIELIFITSIDENKIWNITTREKIELFIEKNEKLSKKISIFENNNPINENKAKKINYALSLLRNKYDLSEYIVGIFDFDARFSIEWFQYLDNISNEKYVLFQFVPLPNINFWNLISYIGNIYHLKRVFSYELYNIYLEYCMWASMFLKWEYLKYNDITEPIDDISLWYKLIIQGHKKITLPYFTYVSIPNNTKDIFNQMLPVYYWIFSYFKLLNSLKNNKIKFYILWFLLYLRILWEYIIIIFFLAFLFLNINVFIFFLLLYIIEGFIYIYFYNKIWNTKISLLWIFLYIFWIFLRISLFIYFILNLIFKFKVLHNIKTTR